jgi:predicted GNAT family N-acyltransferase
VIPDAGLVVSVAAAETYAVRRRVLRDGTPSDDVTFDADHAETTRHLVVHDAEGVVVATSTWIERESPDHPGIHALQLRGMAVIPERRGLRLGVRLIDAGVALARERGCPIVWANARDSALDFYLAHGFTVIGDGFLTHDTRLPHHRIWRPV